MVRGLGTCYYDIRHQNRSNQELPTIILLISNDILYIFSSKKFPSPRPARMLTATVDPFLPTPPLAMAAPRAPSVRVAPNTAAPPSE